MTTSSFTASAYLVKTEPSAHRPPPATRVTVALGIRTEKKNIPRKRFRPPGDGRFFDGHH